MELSVDYSAIVMFDAFRGNKRKKVVDLLRENHFLPIPIPSNCTDRLQPVDVSVNKPSKIIYVITSQSGMHHKYNNSWRREPA